jgi:chemotaxis protein methyltransferase CheR
VLPGLLRGFNDPRQNLVSIVANGVVGAPHCGGGMADTGSFGGIEDRLGLAAAIVDTIREPLLVLDKDLYVVAASRSFCVTFKVRRQDIEGRLLYALQDGQWNVPGLRLLLEKILPPPPTVMEDYEIEQEFSGMGRRAMLLNAREVLNGRGAQKLILLAFEDVTERRAAEREMADLLKQKEVLLEEMQHRVANSLALIASILLLKARTVQSEEIRVHLRDAHQRILSVAAVQQHLQASRHGEQIELAPYLSRLCEALAGSMIGDTRPISIEVRVAEGAASSNTAVSIGLIVTELLINALKHAFGGDRVGGTVLVAYEAAEPSWRLTVSDNGRGNTDLQAVDATPGLGTSIVKALARQLDSRVDIVMASHGTSVSITHGSFTSHPPTAA